MSDSYRPIHPRPRTLLQQEGYVEKLTDKIQDLRSEADRLERQLHWEQKKLDKLQEQQFEENKLQARPDHVG